MRFKFIDFFLVKVNLPKNMRKCLACLPPPRIRMFCVSIKISLNWLFNNLTKFYPK